MAIDILIINQRMMQLLQSMISIGPVTVASYLAGMGYSARVIDNNSVYKIYSTENILSEIGRYAPRVIGLAMNVLNAKGVYDLLPHIRRRFPDTIVVAGGLYSYVRADEMMRAGFDVVFAGEAELSLVRFMEILRRNEKFDRHWLKTQGAVEILKDISGILFNYEGRTINTGPANIIQNLDDLPFLDHELVNLDDYIFSQSDHYGTTNCFNFQRGCPFQCTYCKSEFMAGRIRDNSPEYIVGQIEYSYKKFKFDQFNFVDANFPIDKTRISRFVEKFMTSSLYGKLHFWMQTSVTIPLADSDLQAARAAGVTMISVGVERFDTAFRKLMKKAGTSDQAVTLLKRIKDVGIKTNVNILINFPNDTPEAIEAEERILEGVSDIVDYIGINYLVPLPGTEIGHELGSGANWHLDQKAYYKNVSYYDIAYSITTPGVELNVFSHNNKMIRSLEGMKERQYRSSVVRLNRSLLFLIMFKVDMFMARMSRFLYDQSPCIEHAVFKYLKMLRQAGGKVAMRKFIMRGRS